MRYICLLNFSADDCNLVRIYKLQPLQGKHLAMLRIKSFLL